MKNSHVVARAAEGPGVLLAPFALALAASACEGGLITSPPSGDQGAGDAGRSDAAPGDDASGSDGLLPAEASPPLTLTAVPLEECAPLIYLANVTVGSQAFRLSVDTGSTTLGVASNKCSNCNVTPLYTPGATAVDEMRTVTSQYGRGNWSAEVYQDSVGFASDPTIPLRFGAITNQTNFFGPVVCASGGGMQGIIGLDRASAELPGTNAFFDQFVAAKGLPNVFATELCDSRGTLWLGGYDPSAATAAPQYTPVTTDAASSHYYTVDLETIAVAGSSAPTAIAGGSAYPDTVVDTGTTALLVTNAAFTSLTNAIASSPGFAQIFGAGAGASWFSSRAPCGAAGTTKAQIDAALPALTLTFGKNPGISIQMAASDSYLVPFPGYGWCSLMAPLPAVGRFPLAAILGSPFLRAQITIFDRANGRIGFAPHTACQ
jgi:hypothetical protein